MIKLIIGKKGSGKTKKLVDLVNEAAEKSLGNVVCIEKGDTLTYSVTHKARLIDADAFGISGYGEYYGMVCGIIAQDHDLTEIFVDATFKIVGRDYDEFAALINKLSKVSADTGVDFVFTVSEDKEKLPEALFENVQVI